MTTGWTPTRLGNLLAPVQRSEVVDPAKPYRSLGVRLDGGGPFIRGMKLGSQIAAKNLFRVCTGDFIYSRLFAWRGAFGVINDSMDGCYVSGEFPAFVVNREQADPQFLLLWFRLRRTLERVESLCSGGTPLTRNRFKEHFFLDMSIPLPPLDAQRRVVARIEELAAKTEEARETGRTFARDAQRLSWSFLFGVKQGSSLMPMRDALGLRSPDVEVRSDVLYRFAGVYSHGRGLFSGQCKRGSEFSYPRLTRLRRNNFLYPKLMAWEGALGVVPAECDGLVVSPEFPVFELDENKVLPEVLDTYFRTPQVWPLLSDISTGTNLRRRRLHPNAFLNLQVPLPRMEKQLRFRQMRAKLHLAEESQVQALTEVDAVLPSVLERAFRGDL